MSFYSYSGIPDSVIEKEHKTSTGETYSLKHNEKLKVEMPFLGKENTSANSQGWERNSSKYFEKLYNAHPEMFSKKNELRIQSGHAPVVDQKMISFNKEWGQYRNQTLVHHHIGGDGEAVALPENAHKGQGEIHNHEKAAGITDNCRSFSEKCALKHDSVGKTCSQLHSEINKKSKNAVSLSIGTGATTDRGDALRDITKTKKYISQETRSHSLRKVVKQTGINNAPDRGERFRKTIKGEINDDDKTLSMKKNTEKTNNNSLGNRNTMKP